MNIWIIDEQNKLAKLASSWLVYMIFHIWIFLLHEYMNNWWDKRDDEGSYGKSLGASLFSCMVSNIRDDVCALTDGKVVRGEREMGDG